MWYIDVSVCVCACVRVFDVKWLFHCLWICVTFTIVFGLKSLCICDLLVFACYLEVCFSSFLSFRFSLIGGDFQRAASSDRSTSQFPHFLLLSLYFLPKH